MFNESGQYSGILMPFYESCFDDILLKSSDYMSDNFSSIFNSFDKLSDECIEARDANFENVIFSENEIIIIDSERYCEWQKGETQMAMARNYESACWILYWTLINAAKKHSEFNDTDFYNWFKTIKPDGREICRVISTCKYPIDYLKRVRKKLK